MLSKTQANMLIQQARNSERSILDTNQGCLVLDVQIPQVIYDFLTSVPIAATIRGPLMPQDLEQISSLPISIDPHKAVTSLHSRT